MELDKKIVRCRSCNAEIFFIELENGKKHPVNAKPKKVFISMEGIGWGLETGYESHFSTCPQADSWRRSKTHERKDVNGNVQKDP
jgi:hypothetical protein